MKQGKTCVITGGAGFIGSHLCDSLLDLGNRVICVDNLITGSEENITHARQNKNFSFIHHDVTTALLDIKSVDYIFHLASPASVVDYQKYPKETALVNSIGTMNVLDLARMCNAKFLFASTSEIYGNPSEHPQKETYWGNVNPNGVRSCYDESKRFGEMITMLYQRLYDMDVRIVRIFNTYGPRMRPTDGRVISNFINQAIKNESLTVYGDGLQTRSFCYVSDLVEGIIKAMISAHTRAEVFNLGNPEELRVSDVANKIKKMCRSASPIVSKKLPEDDPERRRPDITKTERILGWHPVVRSDIGFAKTIEYYRSIHTS